MTEKVLVVYVEKHMAEIIKMKKKLKTGYASAYNKLTM